MSKAQDPFATTSDPNLYVPRRATEQALEALADAAWHQGGIAALLGPPGVGKSLLLRVLARRAEDELHCIHVPVPTLDPEGITLWVASRLPGGRRLGGSETLLEVARERPLLLLVEDAELLPGDSARALAELHRASAGAIRAVLAVNAEVLPDSLATALEPECVRVSLDEPMDRDEAVEYVTRRLAAAGVPQSVAERFDAGTIATLHEASAGNPARFNSAARSHMPVAARALAPRPPESGLWQDPFPLEPAVVQDAPPPRDRARRRWVWGVSWALGASAVTFAAGLLLGYWLRGSGPALDGAGERRASTRTPIVAEAAPPAERGSAVSDSRPSAVTAPPVAASAPEARRAERVASATPATNPPASPTVRTPSEDATRVPTPSAARSTASAERGPIGTATPMARSSTRTAQTIDATRSRAAPIADATPPRLAPTADATPPRVPPTADATPPRVAASSTRAPAVEPRQPDPSAATSRQRAAESAPSPARTDSVAPRSAEPVSAEPAAALGVAAAPRVAPDSDPVSTPRPSPSAPAAPLAPPSTPAAPLAPPSAPAPVAALTPSPAPVVGAASPPPAPAASQRRLFAPELPVDLQASVLVRAEPRAFVEIDGHAFGPTPIQITGLRPGAHRLVAHFQTGETMSQELVLSSGERELELRGPLRRPPRIDVPSSPAAPSARVPFED